VVKYSAPARPFVVCMRFHGRSVDENMYLSRFAKLNAAKAKAEAVARAARGVIFAAFVMDETASRSGRLIVAYVLEGHEVPWDPAKVVRVQKAPKKVT
jgi:hypothetical protein